MASCKYTNLCKHFRRFLSTTNRPSHHNHHQHNHEFLEANEFIGCWKTPKDPKEAEAKLAQLRRDYDKQVKNLRKEYIQEVELMRLEKQRKDEASREALRVAIEERKKLKDAAAKVRAEERKMIQEELRQTILKEKAGKLEHWRTKENAREEKKKEENELLRQKSSRDEDITYIFNGHMFIVQFLNRPFGSTLFAPTEEDTCQPPMFLYLIMEVCSSACGNLRFRSPANFDLPNVLFSRFLLAPSSIFALCRSKFPLPLSTVRKDIER